MNIIREMEEEDKEKIDYWQFTSVDFNKLCLGLKGKGFYWIGGIEATLSEEEVEQRNLRGLQVRLGKRRGEFGENFLGLREDFKNPKETVFLKGEDPPYFKEGELFTAGWWLFNERLPHLWKVEESSDSYAFEINMPEIAGLFVSLALSENERESGDSLALEVYDPYQKRYFDSYGEKREDLVRSYSMLCDLLSETNGKHVETTKGFLRNCYAWGKFSTVAGLKIETDFISQLKDPKIFEEKIKKAYNRK